MASHCSQFWQGDSKTIWPLTRKLRKEVYSRYVEWSHEGFDCTAYAYTPLTPARAACLGSSTASRTTLVLMPNDCLAFASQAVDYTAGEELPDLLLPLGGSREQQRKTKKRKKTTNAGPTDLSRHDGIAHRSRAEMVAVAEDLATVGIRFIFYSPYNSRRAKGARRADGDGNRMEFFRKPRAPIGEKEPLESRRLG